MSNHSVKIGSDLNNKSLYRQITKEYPRETKFGTNFKSKEEINQVISRNIKDNEFKKENEMNLTTQIEKQLTGKASTTLNFS